MPKDNHPNNRPIERIRIEDGTELEICQGHYAGELTIKLASCGEELPFLRVASPNFTNIIVLASGMHSEVLGIRNVLDGGFVVETNRGDYQAKRETGGGWSTKCIGKTETKASRPKLKKHKQRSG